MKLKNILLAVNDIERSKVFYRELFGLTPILEQEGNIILTEGLVLQDARTWEEALGCPVISPNHASELYFEEPDIGRFVKVLKGYKEEIRYAEQLTVLPWGQKRIRIYDPDGNLIEVRTPAAREQNYE